MIDGVVSLVTHEAYNRDIFGKITHTNFGWEPDEEAELPKYAPAEPTIFERDSAVVPPNEEAPEEENV